MKTPITGIYGKTVGLACLLLLLGCGKGSTTADPTPADLVKASLLSGTWKLQTVTVDGTDKTDTYTGLTLSFTASSYASTNGRVIWPASGTWKFSDDAGTGIIRDDGLSVAINSSSLSNLVLSLTWSKTTIGGRAESLKGAHVFTFSK